MSSSLNKNLNNVNACILDPPLDEIGIEAIKHKHNLEKTEYGNDNISTLVTEMDGVSMRMSGENDCISPVQGPFMTLTKMTVPSSTGHQ